MGRPVTLFLACPIYGMDLLECEPYPSVILQRPGKLRITEEPLDASPKTIECRFFRVPGTSRYETCSTHHEETSEKGQKGVQTQENRPENH